MRAQVGLYFAPPVTPPAPSPPPPAPPPASPSLVCGAGTALNQTTYACEISCSSDSDRRLAEADWSSPVSTAARVAASDPDKLSSRELVAGYLAHNSELAARLDVVDGIDDALVEHVEQLVQLFGPPALV